MREPPVEYQPRRKRGEDQRDDGKRFIRDAASQQKYQQQCDRAEGPGGKPPDRGRKAEQPERYRGEIHHQGRAVVALAKSAHDERNTDSRPIGSRVDQGLCVIDVRQLVLLDRKGIPVERVKPKKCSQREQGADQYSLPRHATSTLLKTEERGERRRRSTACCLVSPIAWPSRFQVTQV